jgi:hypothetical protein
MGAYEALVRAYSEEAGSSSPDGDMDYLLADIANFVESETNQPTVMEFQFLAATLTRAARYVKPG